MTTEAYDPDFHLQRSSRDPEKMGLQIGAWLASQLPPGAEPDVRLTTASDSNGMSSETVLADVTWTEDGQRRTGEFVVRIAPDTHDVPVFESYRPDHQHEAIRLVAELSDVPVPTPRWLEPTGDVLGTAFFFMDRVDGIVPPDVMPYTFGGNWFFDASPEDQRRLQDSTVAVIAGLHQIPDAERVFGFLDAREHDGPTPLRRHVEKTRSWYEWAATQLDRSALIDRALTWLDANWPAADVPDNVVLSWGDARIGNILFRDFTPAAVLDWEMAGIGPRELDLAWLVFAHQVFQTLAETFELPGMPDTLREEDVRATYAEITGVEVGDLTWFRIYSAVIWAVVFMRTGTRQAHFGEIEMPATPEELMHHAPLFTRMLDDAEQRGSEATDRRAGA
ncbi:MAG TPA: phosphotransferase family protein [Marmoricola sp.]|nr:phosphotransferase family protein [Marmoricola sp.]